MRTHVPLLMSQRRACVFWTIVASVSVVALVSFRGVASRLTPENGALQIDPELLEIGRVWEQANLPWSLRIHNTSSEDIDVLDIATSCRCATVAPDRFTVKAKSFETISVNLDVRADERNTSLSRVRPFQVRIRPKLASSWGEGWVLSAMVQRALAIEPRVVNFGEVVFGEQHGEKRATIRALVPVIDIAASSESQMLSASIRPGATSSDFELICGLSSKIEPGRAHELVILTPTLANGAAIPPVEILISAVINEPVYAEPSLVAFTQLAMGETAREFVSLRSKSSKPFDVSSISTGSPSTVVTIEQQSPDRQSVLCRVEQTASSLTEQRTRVHIRVLIDSLTREIELPVVWHLPSSIEDRQRPSDQEETDP